MRISVDGRPFISRSAGCVRTIVPQRVPSHIPSGGFVDSSSNRRQVRGNVVLKTVFANVMQKLLHLRNLDHASAAERIEWIIREATFANVAAHSACSVIG